MLLVGVGAPKQEKWMMKYCGRMSSVKLFMALGATINFEAGTALVAEDGHGVALPLLERA